MISLNSSPITALKNMGWYRYRSFCLSRNIAAPESKIKHNISAQLQLKLKLNLNISGFA